MGSQRIERRDFMKTVAAVTAGLSVGGCVSAADTRKKTMRIATFCCDATLPLGTPIYSSYKPLEVIEHPLLAKGVVLDIDGKRYVLCAVDWCEICNGTHTLFRKLIAEAVGTDPAYVAVQTVHQHTAPMADNEAFRMVEQTENPPRCPSPSVFETIAKSIAASVKESLPSMKPFDRIGTGQAKVERVASIRRIILPDGKFVGRMSSCTDPAVSALPEGNIDPYLKTITFAKGDQPLARLHYYATHPQSFYGDPRATYDFVGMAREALQEKEKVFQMYFTGCAGDVAAGKYNDRTPEARQGLYERILAGMEASVAATQYGPVGPVTWRTATFAPTWRTDGEYADDKAKALLADKTAGDLARVNAAIILSFHARMNTPVELSSLQFGDVHILHLPGEPMVEFQLYAQQLLPKSFVAVAGYGDCGPAYICTAKSFDEGGYEPGASHTVRETEELFRAVIRQLAGVA